MSGGHFNYQQYTINQIASQIEHAIYINDSTELNEFGDRIGRGYSPEVIARFRTAVRMLQIAFVYTHRIDWLLSGDDGEEQFFQRLLKDLQELDKEAADAS